MSNLITKQEDLEVRQDWNKKMEEYVADYLQNKFHYDDSGLLGEMGSELGIPAIFIHRIKFKVQIVEIEFDEIGMREVYNE